MIDLELPCIVLVFLLCLEQCILVAVASAKILWAAWNLQTGDALGAGKSLNLVGLMGVVINWI